MMMKQSLSLQIGQQLTMTPQLQQAIRLLQLSTLELDQEIREALDSNPLLEQHEDEQTADPLPSPASESADAATAGEQPMDMDAQSSIPEDLPVDTAWEDVFSGTSTTGLGSGGGDGDDEYLLETRNAVASTLQDELLWQLNLTPFSDLDRAIAVAVIDAIDERGYLCAELEDLRSAVLPLFPDHEIDDGEILAVIHRLQHFDPPGVAARDLRECLLIQLEQLAATTPWRSAAIRLVNEHLALLGQHDYVTLQRRLKLDADALRGIITLIQSLNPHPGSRSGGDDTDYITPDVILRKTAQGWRVELNPDHLPRLRINQDYASLIRRADSGADNTYLKNHLQEARWFIKSLQSRNETILKVASCIVRHQRRFLEEGPEAMQALVLRDVAEEVGMHESTISRVTHQKYMLTPRGIFELKYFFSSHVTTSSGGECSSTAIRAMIRKLVGQEDVRKPLSDNKIADLLEAQGIQVARRTIAKYRESLNIAPSNERKRLL